MTSPNPPPSLPLWEPADEELQEISEAWWESNSARRLAVLSLRERQLRRDAEASALRQRHKANEAQADLERAQATLARVESLKPTHLGAGQWVIPFRDLKLALQQPAHALPPFVPPPSSPPPSTTEQQQEKEQQQQLLLKKEQQEKEESRPPS